MAVTTTTVRVAVPGLHHWPKAPDRRGYLVFPHRHLFGVTVTVLANHTDRDTEYHDLQAEVLAVLPGRPYAADPTMRDFATMSCEQIAEAVALELAARGFPVLEVRVSEDGENEAAHIVEELMVEAAG